MIPLSECIAGDIDVGAEVIDGVVIREGDSLDAAARNGGRIGVGRGERQVEISRVGGRLNRQIVDHDLRIDRAARALHVNGVAALHVDALIREDLIEELDCSVGRSRRARGSACRSCW